MWFRLAALWGCTVTEAQNRCDPREFDEWMTFYRIEPWGSAIEDLRIGILASAVANYSGRVEKTRTPADMVPWIEKPESAKPMRQLQEEVRGFLAERKRS
jgi:hypothetical protein